MKRTIVFLLSLAALTGCWRTVKDLSSDPRFVGLIGKQYQTKAELVVYRFSGEEYPGISKAGVGPLPSAEELRKQPFPYKYYDTNVLGVLPAGSELRLSMVREEGSLENAFVYFYVTITKSVDSQWIGKTVNASASLIASDAPLTFKPQLIEEMAVGK